jgi:hypothetical protein
MPSLLQKLRLLRLKGSSTFNQSCIRPRIASLQVEALEPRCVPATYTFIGPAGGDWNNRTNWSGKLVPGANDTAIINSGSSVVVSDVEIAQAVELGPGASLAIATGTVPSLEIKSSLMDQGALNVNAALNLDPGSTTTITGAGTFTDQGTIQVAASSTLLLQVAHVSSAAGTLAFALTSADSSVDLTGGQTVNYSGTFAGTGPGLINLSSGTVHSTAGLDLDFTNPNGLSWTGGTIGSSLGTVTNEGTIVISGAGGSMSGANVENEGLLAIGSGAKLSDVSAFNQSSTGALIILIAGPSSSGHFGQVQAAQSSSLGGALIAEVAPGYVPQGADQYPVIVAPSLSGSFADLQIDPLASRETATTYFLDGEGALPALPRSTTTTTTPTPAPPLVVPPTSPAAPLVVLPGGQTNPFGTGNFLISPMNAPHSASGGRHAELGGGAGGPPEPTPESSRFASASTLSQYFANLDFALQVRTADLTTSIRSDSAFSTSAGGGSERPPAEDARFAHLPPMLRFFIAAIGVGPAQAAMSINDGSTNVDQIYDILSPPGASDPSATAEPRSLPLQTKLVEPEASEGIVPMLAVFSLALLGAFPKVKQPMPGPKGGDC